MLNGIILAVLEDMGPAARINISHLSEIESMKLAVAAMTAVGLGNDTARQRRNLYGTFPVANRDEYRALVFPFSVSGEKSADNRVRHFGRECSIFLLFNREFRDEVFNKFAKIEHLLREETDPSVRVVLGHFVFVYIHPYMDGNGRIGRFLMNLMLASGGYPWTVVPTEKREEYMAVLEDASVNQTIIPLTKFLARLVKQNL